MSDHARSSQTGITAEDVRAQASRLNLDLSDKQVTRFVADFARTITALKELDAVLESDDTPALEFSLPESSSR